LTRKIIEELRKRIIKELMDIIVLTELTKAPMSGYDLISRIHNKYGILVSSGTVYGLLYSLERQDLIKGAPNERKRVYLLTKKGKQNIENIEKANGEIQNLLTNILSINMHEQQAFQKPLRHYSDNTS
jgi:DNA-binding PadR family transcriptional regulator